MTHILNPSKKPQLFILLLLATFASVSAVLYTPSLPEIAESLKITSTQAQFSMTAFLIGYALGNLPYGPLSNRFGRKPTLYLGILLAIGGSLLILLAASLQLFGLFVLGNVRFALHVFTQCLRRLRSGVVLDIGL